MSRAAARDAQEPGGSIPVPRFLSLENVLHLHSDTIREEGGSTGIRDMGAIQSAIAQPLATFEGAYLHDGLAAMAAACLFTSARITAS